MIRFKEALNPWGINPNSSAFDQRLSFRLQQTGIQNPNLLLTPIDRQIQYDKLIGMTGNTPITKHENSYGTILMKRLSQNPSECHYDLVYLKTLQFLEDQDVIWPKDKNSEHNGQRVELVELTSGSAGISFGFATKMLGFEGTLFVPEEIPDARIHPMKSLGLNIVRTPPGYVEAASKHLGSYIEELKADGYKFVRFRQGKNRSLVFEKGDHRVCIVNHSENQITIDAFRTVGEEMANYLPEGVKPDYLITIIGNFTSTTGITSSLKEKYRDLKIIGLESTENPNWFDQRYPQEFKKRFGREPSFEATKIFGTSQRGVPLYFANPDIFSDILLFEPDQAMEWQREHNNGKSSVETIGRSTAAELMAAEKLAKEHPGSIIFVLNYDKGDRYETVSPEFVPTISLLDARAQNRFDPNMIQPRSYRQPQPKIPTQIPRTLAEAYSSSPLAA